MREREREDWRNSLVVDVYIELEPCPHRNALEALKTALRPSARAYTADWLPLPTRACRRDPTPFQLQVNSKGQLLGSEFITENTHQFITVASDGQCLIWDTRYQVCRTLSATKDSYLGTKHRLPIGLGGMRQG